EIAYTIINPINKKTRVVLAKGKALFNADNIAYRFSGTLQDITEQTLTFKRVEDAEERLQIATDIIGIATWELDLKEYTLIHTSRLAEIFGQPKSTQITHEEMRSQIHPDDLKNVVDASFQQALKTGVYEYEARVLKPTFTTCWIRAQGKVFYDKNKQAIKIIGSIKEITDEKKQQQELLESEQKFRLLADSMPQFIWTSDAEGNLNYFSQSVYNYSGLTPEQINKEGWLQIVHPDEKDENISKWLHSVKTGEEFIFEHRFRRHDGEYRWQLSRAIPQRNEDGIIQKWVGTSTDIEDQKMFASQLKKQVDMRTKELKKLNEELIKSEVRYHLMVNEIQDYAIIFLNKDGVIENWNRGAKKIKGYDDNEIIGKNFSVFYTEEDRNTNLPKKLLEIALQTGKATHEGWRVKKDTSLFWAHIVITAIHDEKKNIIGFTKVTHDLTDKKQANDRIKLDAEQLELKNKELEKMNAELQSFAYVSSHDLQEPLRKIQTFATRILEKEHANLSDNGKNYFHRMQESANKMQTLIEDLLTYSRTNTTENIFKNTDLTELINEVKNDFKEVLAENHATIEIGEMCEAVIIPFQFRQIMQNLIGNSLKFAKPDVPPHIIIKSEIVKGADLNNESLSEEKNYCHISISDNGIGFDEQYKDRIFEVFQRLHGKAEYKGTGIGLAIVKKIIENHNGIITASGKLNEGATFDIYIPSS
ncbi:MAG: PAS domain S-box protein, partial [Bacteroidia bacterium]